MSKKINTMILSITAFAAFLVMQPVAFGAESIPLDLPIGLKVGETASIDSKLKMTLLDVEDSRCPSDVTCVWQGTVFAKIQLVKGDQAIGSYTIYMETKEGNEQAIEGYHIRLTNVEPYPMSSMQVQPTEYVLTFFVSMAETNYFDSPLNQYNSGIPFNEIKCNSGLQITQRYDGRPACVKPATYFELIKRDGVSNIIIIQSRSEDDQNQTIQPVIKTGTNSGHCIGYCSKEFIITPEKITYTESGRDVSDKTKDIPFSKSNWNELVDLIDVQKFNSLPDRIGCPGCADAPVEWIEITFGNKTKRIEFENGDDIPEINKLISVLQKIRSPIVTSIESFEDCVAAGNPIMESYPRQCKTNDGMNFVEVVESHLDLQSQCKKHGGGWLSEFNECEYISEDQCLEMKGMFKECESACRHNDSDICTKQCVQVCIVP
ncbi:Hypothetical protein Nlim_0984 [Candidatus Nitrosarchaeum limnium SFB1]|jgi:hypothetical protein|uniref:Uncharacterized protein n=1 Tax=Candidatus Nitrosarchaeum limnium SFB1 TaxID=886738 RepID=F3KKG8_9ARCH|nr:Hypothetical protein Nlim_0984 [Candidatus Nitrosarchaeum limnium SFB1]